MSYKGACDRYLGMYFLIGDSGRGDFDLFGRYRITFVEWHEEYV